MEWLQEWKQIKVKPQSKRWGHYVPKRPRIVHTAETTASRTAAVRVHSTEQGGDDGAYGEAQWTGPPP